MWVVETAGFKARCFANGKEFLSQFRSSWIGCLLLDMRMPEVNGLDLCERLLAAGVQMPVLMMTSHGDVSIAVRAMKLGILEFLEKPFGDEILLSCVRKALEADAHRRREIKKISGILGRMSVLTKREMGVYNLLLEGKSNRAIAEELGLSPKTVEVHRAHVMRKMGAHSIADLVRFRHAYESSNVMTTRT